MTQSLTRMLLSGDDAEIFAWLKSDEPIESPASKVAALAGQIVFQQNHTVLSVCFLPGASGPQVAGDMEALGITLRASRTVAGHLVCTYDQVRTPCLQFQAAAHAITGGRANLEHAGVESLPLFLLLAIPASGIKISIAHRLARLNHIVSELSIPAGVLAEWMPAAPLPEAVELGRARWLACQAETSPLVAMQTYEWGYSVTLGDLCYEGECLFTPWGRLSKVLPSR